MIVNRSVGTTKFNPTRIIFSLVTQLIEIINGYFKIKDETSCTEEKNRNTTTNYSNEHLAL